MKLSVTLILFVTFSPTYLEFQNPTCKSHSEFNLLSGQKVIAFEDFEPAAIGDFPAKWNSDRSSEVITLDGQQGKWLTINELNKGC